MKKLEPRLNQRCSSHNFRFPIADFGLSKTESKIPNPKSRYASAIASDSHWSTHCPQLTQVSASIEKRLSPLEIASTGQISLHLPQAVHLSDITYAMFHYSFLLFVFSAFYILNFFYRPIARRAARRSGRPASRILPCVTAMSYSTRRNSTSCVSVL